MEEALDLSFDRLLMMIYIYICICVCVCVYKGKFTLEQPTKAQRGTRGIAPLLFNLGATWGGWLTPRLGRFTPEKDPVRIV